MDLLVRIMRYMPSGSYILPIAVIVAVTIAYIFRRSGASNARPAGTALPSRTEQIKLLASYLNTIGAGFMVTGVVGPIATYFYGTTNGAIHPAWQLGVEIGGLIGLSIGAHLAARRALRRLDP